MLRQAVQKMEGELGSAEAALVKQQRAAAAAASASGGDQLSIGTRALTTLFGGKPAVAPAAQPT